MSQKAVSVRREDDYFMVDFPIPDGQIVFEKIGDVVIGLKFYLRDHWKELKARPELPELDYTELDDRDRGILEKGLYGLYEFKG
jgi:hypothetical protein